MKRINLLLSFWALLCVCASSKSFTKEQLSLRLNIIKYLNKEGFHPQIDKDGDVSFQKEDVHYCAIINDEWTDPFVVTIFAQYAYEGSYSKKNIENCSSIINTNKAVKIVTNPSNFSYNAEFFCKDAVVFEKTFYSIMNQMEISHRILADIVGSGMSEINYNNPDSVFDKATSYYVMNEDKKSFKLFKFLEEQEYKKAYKYLASSYRYGYGTDIDYEEMEKYYKKAIEFGDLSCAYYLADYYFENKLYENAYDNFMKCATNDGSFKSLGLYKTGYMEENGLGVNSDLEKAKASYRKSVQYSYVKNSDARKALMRLGEVVEKKEDFVDATKSMLAGLSPQDMFTKGTEYEKGLKRRFVSLPKAYAYYKAAAENGYIQAYSKMGEIYIDEYYPFNDKEQSDKWYQKAFKIYRKNEASDGDACYQMGLLYEYGLGVQKNDNMAKEYYLKGANLKDNNAAWKYGLCLKEENEYADAFKYFLQAANNGQASAMFELAYLYEVGYGTYQNKELAIKWYNKCYKAFGDNWQKAKEALIRLDAFTVRE